MVPIPHPAQGHEVHTGVVYATHAPATQTSLAVHAFAQPPQFSGSD